MLLDVRDPVLDGWRVVAKAGENYIAVDDHCYLFLMLKGNNLNDPPFTWKPSAWWPRYAVEVLRGLPDDPDKAEFE